MEKLLLVYEFVDTGTDGKLAFDLFYQYHYGWGTISVISLLFGSFNLSLGLACMVSNSILQRFPYLNALTIKKKNLITSIFAKNVAGSVRRRNLFFYLCLFKLPEDVPCAVVRLYQHDLEKDILFTIGSVSTIIGLALTSNVVLSFTVRLIFDIALMLLAMFTLAGFCFFFSSGTEELDERETYIDVLKSKLYRRVDVKPEIIQMGQFSLSGVDVKLSGIKK